MANAPHASAAVRNAMLNAITTAIGTTGRIRIFTGTAPADADTALSGNTRAAMLTMSATPFPAASGGSMAANAITNDTNAAGGNPVTFFRVTDANATDASAVTYLQGTVGTSASDLNLNSTNIAAGATVSISSFTVSMAA